MGDTLKTGIPDMGLPNTPLHSTVTPFHSFSNMLALKYVAK